MESRAIHWHMQIAWAVLIRSASAGLHPSGSRARVRACAAGGGGCSTHLATDDERAESPPFLKMGAALSRTQLEGLRSHTYACEDRSLLCAVMQPFWKWSVEQVEPHPTFVPFRPR